MLFSWLVSLRIRLVMTWCPGPSKCSEGGNIAIAAMNGRRSSFGGSVLVFDCVADFLMGSLRASAIVEVCHWVWSTMWNNCFSICFHGKKEWWCQPQCGLQAAGALGLAVGLCSIGWHYRGHGRAREIITKGQVRGNSTSHFLGFNKMNTFSAHWLLGRYLPWLYWEWANFPVRDTKWQLARVTKVMIMKVIFFNAVTKYLREINPREEDLFQLKVSAPGHWALFFLGYCEIEHHGWQHMTKRLAAHLKAARKQDETCRARCWRWDRPFRGMLSHDTLCPTRFHLPQLPPSPNIHSIVNSPMDSWPLTSRESISYSLKHVSILGTIYT